MLHLLDTLLTIAHLLIVVFNLFGWIWKKTRKAHLVCVLLTAGSWFVLGIWYGWGYCPVTDWQWDVKHRLGETNLPSSFIKYYADKLSGTSIDAALVDAWTGILFGIAALLSVYFNFLKKASSQ